MCSVTVIGHSLIPTTVNLDIDNVTLDIYRFPGATIDSLNRHLDQRNFWVRAYDLIILCIGGNDLTNDNVSDVFDKFCYLVRRLLPQTTKLSAYTVEYRIYQTDNRFRADRETYRRKVTKINLKLKSDDSWQN